MMLVRCRLAPSPIEGLGVFAAESIAAGQPVWRLDPGWDCLIHPHQLIRLPPAQREFLERYSYHDDSRDAFILCCDDARFMNHSSRPNVSAVEGDHCTALRAIAEGEELTCNYHDLDTRIMRFVPRD